MTFDARERSTYGGEPFELYSWILGTTFWRQTSGDTVRTFQGHEYKPYALARTEVDQNGEAGSGNITVTMDLDNPVAQLFLPVPPSQPMGLIIICGHDGEIDSESACVFTGKVLSPKISEGCEFTCAPRQTNWKQPVPALSFQCQCPLRWGSPRCGVNKEAWKVVATLSAVSGLTVRSAAFAAHADGHFKGGWIEAGGELEMIAAHVGEVLTLQTPIPGLASGATVAAFPGCQGTEEDCGGRYGNLDNHLGFSRIPSRQPFDSGGI